MSPWPHSELRIALCPQEVTVLARALGVPRRGPAERLSQRCEMARPAKPWKGALDALAAVLPKVASGRTSATVVLSNEWLLYAVVPWQAGLGGSAERLAYARHCFSRVYGKECEGWELRLSAAVPGASRVGSLLDPELLEALRSVFAREHVRLHSIQPFMMAGFNAFRAQAATDSAWLALVEPGYLCVALLRAGEWVRVQGLRSNGAVEGDLLPLLERECFLGDPGGVPGDVYVLGLADATPLPAPQAPWSFHAVPPVAPFIALPAEGGPQ